MTIDFESRQIEKNEEQDIVLGMIISTDFLKRIRPMYKPEYFSLYYAKTVAGWCIEYFDKYQKAPFTDIKSIFEAKKNTIISEDKAEMIDTFLARISDKFEQEDEHYNLDFNVDKAKNFFKGSNAYLFEEKIRGLRLLGDYEAIDAEVARFKRVDELISMGSNFWDKDTERISDTLNSIHDTNALLRLPGELGSLIRPLQRGDFLALVGPAKRGKSYLLMELALWACFNRCNVLFFSWEMPRRDVDLRLYQRLTGTFIPGHEEEYEKEVEVPYFDNNFYQNQLIHKRKVIKKAVNFSDVYQKIKHIDSFIKGKQLRIECAPSKSMSGDDMRNVMDNLAYYEGFEADVVVTDYADIGRSSRKEERRHEIDSVWLDHRAIGQERDQLIISASHTNKQTFSRDIRESDMSEDNRKLNHVTMALALNSSEEDQLNNSIRIRPLVDRYRGVLPNKEAVVLQCLECGQPYLDSRIMKIENK